MHSARLTLALLAGTGILLSACAKSPEAVEAAYVSPASYSGADCKALQAEYHQAVARQKKLEESQRNHRIGNVVAVALFGALGGLATKDGVEKELARAKGEVRAIEESMRNKGCSIGQGAI